MDGCEIIDARFRSFGSIRQMVRSASSLTISNLAFGGRNRSRLFLSAGQMLYAIHINKRGADRP